MLSNLIHTLTLQVLHAFDLKAYVQLCETYLQRRFDQSRLQQIQNKRKISEKTEPPSLVLLQKHS